MENRKRSFWFWLILSLVGLGMIALMLFGPDIYLWHNHRKFQEKEGLI